MTMFEEKLAGFSGGKVLDVATQGGWFADKLKDAFRDFDEIIGIDITDEDFDEARQRLNGFPVSFVVMDGANLGFSDESFDTVAMSAGMHHLDNIPAVLSEMMRVLKPGGTFVLREGYRDDQNEKQITDVMQHDWSAKIDRLLGKPHYPTLTRQKIVDYATGLGLCQLETENHSCEDCPRSKGETIEKEVADMSDDLEKIRTLPEYDELKSEADVIIDRLRTIGVACQASLDIIGIK